MNLIVSGSRPEWPVTVRTRPRCELRSLVEESWSQDPERRPTMPNILARLTELEDDNCFDTSDGEERHFGRAE
jgi:hypothetical protein